MKTRFLPCVLLAILAAPMGATGAAPKIDPALLAAIRSGDSRELRAVLSRGAELNARDTLGNTPLMLGTVYGDLPSMRLLLDRGAEVNAANGAGATALMRATFDDARVRLLLERGADVNARSATGQTPLLLAARRAGGHRVVEWLLRRGADPNGTNVFGASPLMAATAAGDAASVRLLLDRGANPNALPGQDEPGFLFGGGRSPLMWAAFRGDTAIVRRLLDAGAQVNVPSLLGTPLAQAAWADRTAAARLLLERGAKPGLAGFMDGYNALHWAASSEQGNQELVALLLRHGADPDAGGGEHVDAFLGTPQTPLMLAKRRGSSGILASLAAAGATRETPDRTKRVEPPKREIPARLDSTYLRAAIACAVEPLHATSLQSKTGFLKHASKQDCTSCHQQHLPMAAIGLARRFGARVNADDEAALIAMVREGEIKDPEFDWQPLFHPDPAMTKGYELLAYAAEELPADSNSDAWVHHLAAIQGPDGQWYNNLPRPPIQTGDIGATALAVHALQRYPIPGRRTQLAAQVDRARRWLQSAQPANTDSRIYQLLGLAWAGESAARLRPLAITLLAEQRDDGGWAQLPGLASDAYATAQAIYALRLAAGLAMSDPGVDRGLRFLLRNQLQDGTWHVARRAFPFQPTIDSGFPHGRDSWISAAATSWAVMALSLPEDPARTMLAAQKR